MAVHGGRWLQGILAGKGQESQSQGSERDKLSEKGEGVRAFEEVRDRDSSKRRWVLSSGQSRGQGNRMARVHSVSAQTSPFTFLCQFPSQ